MCVRMYALRTCVSGLDGTQTNAVFRFVPKLEERMLCRPWLSVHPPFGFLLPGQSADVSFELYVGVATARDLRCECVCVCVFGCVSVHY